MVQKYPGADFWAGDSILPKAKSLWFNMLTTMFQSLWQRILFIVGIIAALLIATNPKFVLPYKYYLTAVAPSVNSQLLVTPQEVEQTASVLPDEFTLVNEDANNDSLGGLPPSDSHNEPAAALSTTPSAQAASLSPNQSPTVWLGGSLSIPSLKITAPLVYVSERSEKAFQLGLQRGVVQYPGTALPGQLGNVYIFGHSSDYSWAKGSYKTVLAKLPQIKLGSEIKLTDGAGTVYTYKVIKTAIVLPTETKYLSQYNYQKKLLTVQTSYPVGTALKRFLAIAELVD